VLPDDQTAGEHIVNQLVKVGVLFEQSPDSRLLPDFPEVRDGVCNAAGLLASNLR
jgi:hypothetical protein